MAWSFARLEFQPDLGFMHSLVAAAHRQLALFRAQDLASLLRALAQLRHHPGAVFLEAIEDECSRCVAASAELGRRC